jgi:transposase
MHDADEPPPLVSAADWAKTPPQVQQAFLTLVEMVQMLSAEVQELRVRVTQTSRNSSKPPSSDPPSAPPAAVPRVPRGRKAGAQQGHPDQQRPLLPPEQVDTIVVLRPNTCPSCHTTFAPDLPLSGPTWYCQIWELPPIRAHLTEYQQQTLCCPTCQHAVTADLPADVPPGAFGARATALIGLLHGRYRLSARETTAFLSEVCGLPLSLGSVISSCQRLSCALAPIDAAIQACVQTQPYVWVDETSWRQKQQSAWLWVGVSPIATCFRIDRSRSQAARQRLLGEAYGGIVHSDRAHAYGDLPLRQRQMCWAHLLRNFQGLLDQQHVESWWAQRMLSQARLLFAAWGWFRAGWFDRIALQQALIPVRTALRDLLEQGGQSAWQPLRRLSRRLLRTWDALWMFSQVEGIEPTNNMAERALRPAVVWRKSCFGTQSAEGSRFVERMLSVRATCVQQGQNLFRLLVAALHAAWTGAPAPTLVPTP